MLRAVFLGVQLPLSCPPPPLTTPRRCPCTPLRCRFNRRRGAPGLDLQRVVHCPLCRKLAIVPLPLLEATPNWSAQQAAAGAAGAGASGAGGREDAAPRAAARRARGGGPTVWTFWGRPGMPGVSANISRVPTLPA